MLRRRPSRRFPRPVLTVAALAAMLATAGGAVAPAQTGGDRATFAFTAKGAGQLTGFTVSATLPRQRDLSRVQVRFPAGTRVDTKALDACVLGKGGPLDSNVTAGDPLAACPASSKVAEGSVRIVGSPGGVVGLPNGKHQVTIFARSGAKLYVVLSRGGDSELSTGSSISNSGFTLAAIPEGAKSIDSLTLTGRRVVNGSRALFRTPRTCPKSRRLSAGVVLVDADGGATSTARATTTCRP